MLMLLILFAASLWAGAQNSLAGGGSFVTFPALMLAGLDARLANVTSTVALFPSQAVAGWATRGLATGAPGVGLGVLCGISLVGGGVGALLLLATPSAFFARLVPWMVVFATGVFAWGSFGRRGERRVALPVWATLGVQAGVAVYGGYFGGGIGLMMLAVLTFAGAAVRGASASKNVLAGVINAGAVVVFALSPDVRWGPASVICAGSMLGGLGGAWLLRIVSERVLRGGVVVVGLALAAGLFWRQG